MRNWFENLLEATRQQFGSTFRSFANANYRTYLTGQLISLSGTSMQAVALAWVVYLMTGSASMLGLVTVASSAPVILLALAGGMVADRFDKRKVLIIAQVVSLILALVLGLLFITDHLAVWMILAISVGNGIVGAFEMPTRQSFVSELVGNENTVNAVSLNSAVFNTTRLLGPALAALTLSLAGPGVCFFLNAASFVAAIVALALVKTQSPSAANANTATGKSGSGKTGSKQDPPSASVFDGLRFAIAEKKIRALLFSTGCLSLFGFQFVVFQPVFAAQVLGGNELTLCLLSAATATGSLLGALLVASFGRKEMLMRTVPIASLALGICLIVLSFSSYTAMAVAVVFLTGGSVAVQVNAMNSMLQLAAPASIRGRVMSMYTMFMVGGVPFGSLVAGHIADVTGVTTAIRLCGVACLLATIAFSVMPKGNDNGQETRDADDQG